MMKKKKKYNTPAFCIMKPIAEEICAGLDRSSNPAATGQNYYGDGGDNYAKSTNDSWGTVWDDIDEEEDADY